MSRLFRPSRIDANQRAIVEALREIGASVELLHAVGRGCPDLLVGYRGRTVLAEVKRDAKAAGVRPSRSHNSITRERQKAWVAAWRGGQVVVVTSPESAVQAVLYLETASQDAPGSTNAGGPDS